MIVLQENFRVLLQVCVIRVHPLRLAVKMHLPAAVNVFLAKQHPTRECQYVWCVSLVPTERPIVSRVQTALLGFSRRLVVHPRAQAVPQVVSPRHLERLLVTAVFPEHFLCIHHSVLRCVRTVQLASFLKIPNLQLVLVAIQVNFSHLVGHLHV
jgi:hypothetical protein